MALPPSPPSKIGLTSTDRNQASVPSPSPTISGAELTTEVYTFIAQPSSDGKPVVLYNADRQYARVTLTLENAGPVVIGNKQQLVPVLSGKGALLNTDMPFAMTVTKGNKIYIATTSINRVKVLIEPVPWLEQIAGMISALPGMLANAIKNAFKR